MLERTDWNRIGHLVFVGTILAYSVWYAFDAIGTVENIESAMAVVVCAALCTVLGVLILVREGFRTRTAVPADASAPLASPALICAATVAYVVLIAVIGIEVPTFLYIACLAWLLGVRSILINLFYSAAFTGLLVWMVYTFADAPEPIVRLFGTELVIDLSALSGAFHLLGSEWAAWLWIVPGVLIGVVSGAIPGFNSAIAMVILLPATVFMDFLSAIVFLTSIWTGGSFGAGVPSILLNVPGSPAAVATAFDGHPMTTKGLHNQALGMALAASVVSSAASYLILVVLIGPIAELVVRMGPTEMLVVLVWGLTLVASLGREGMLKGLFATVVGVLLGTIGSSVMGDIRGTMGIPHLMEGIPKIAALVGLFAIGEMLFLARGGGTAHLDGRQTISLGRIWAGVGQTFRYPVVLARGAVIGACIGALPGVGASIANLMSYHAARRRSRHPERFGTGTPEGVVAAELANSSSEGGSMATMLVFGIPGSGGTAIMLSAFALHDVTAGPEFFVQKQHVVYAILLANVLEALALFAIGLAFVRFAANIIRVPLRFLIPAVFASTVIGGYLMTDNMAGPVTVVFFGIVGYVMRLYGYPVAAMVIGLLLGTKVEFEFTRSLQISGGELSYLLDRPMTLVLAAAMIVSIVSPAIVNAWRRGRARRRTLSQTHAN